MSEAPIRRATYSVESALSKLGDASEVTSWEITQQLLVQHGEYASGKGEQVAATRGPVQQERLPASLWVERVKDLFDPEMVGELHGRLLILGLCHLDANLQEYLEGQGFVRQLKDELKEDFESLLLPEHAGARETYRREFLQILQNKGKYGKSIRETRTAGFVVTVDGGPGLAQMVELSQRQDYNQVFCARYQVASGATLGAAIADWVLDLQSLQEGNTGTRGSFVPDLATDLRTWRTSIVKPLSRFLESVSGSQPSSQARQEIVRGLFEELRAEEVLPAGRRLVLFIEFRRVPGDADLETIGVDSMTGAILQDLPERVGIVLSGLPQAVPDGLQGRNSFRLSIPDDRELMGSQALANDTPAGPDRLNIASEVNAIAEAITLKDMKPPMVVGVLGGWGAGKSFVLHLIESRIQEIRCEPVFASEGAADPDFPFVGHPYLIRFDAWTYAKGNLWASLMQQIFLGLDRQIGLEQTLASELNIDPKADSEIWRVLSQLTSEEQDRLIKTELGKKAVQIAADFEKGQIAESHLWDVLEKLKEEEIELLQKAENELEVTRVTLEEARRDLEVLIEEDIERDARTSAWKAVADEWVGQIWEQWKKEQPEIESDPPTLEELQGATSWIQKVRKNPQALALSFVVFALAGAIVAILAKLEWQVVPWISAIAATVGSVVTGWRSFQKWFERSANRFEDESRRYRSLAENHRKERLLGAVKRAVAGEGDPDDPELLEKAKRLDEFEKKYDDKQAEVETRRQRVGMAGRHDNLLEFVSQRLEGRFYEDKLGLLHQVKSDLEDLSDALLHGDPNRMFFPRGDPRIILLIDDLDRCPPDKVVEVLEAAQLLVKTPLFVVVIAMDVRYVTRALEDVYDGVLMRWGEPSGLDYIEKIIQIPYRVRPVSEGAVRSFLWSHMSPEHDGPGTGEGGPTEDETPASVTPGVEDESPPGRPEPVTSNVELGEESSVPRARRYESQPSVLPTKTLRFSREDHELITSCCAAFEVSPRTMKRLVNVFKLLKIIWYRQGLDTGPAEGVKKAMLALLVVAARYPEPMRQLLHGMERHFAEPRSAPVRSQPDGDGEPMDQEPEDPETVVGFLLGRCREHRSKALIRLDWDQVEIALQNPALISQEVTFEDLSEQHLHLVSSLSFIGESDPEREAALRRDLYGPLVVAGQRNVPTVEAGDDEGA